MASIEEASADNSNIPPPSSSGNNDDQKSSATNDKDAGFECNVSFRSIIVLMEN